MHDGTEEERIKFWSEIVRVIGISWLGGSVVERQYLTGELSLVCTGPAADG